MSRFVRLLKVPYKFLARDSIICLARYMLSPVRLSVCHMGVSYNQTVNDGVAHSRIGTLDQPVAA